MEIVFIVIAATLAAVLIWQVSPAGFNKLTDLDANLPTFTSVFGKLGFPILIAVGFIEFFVPALLLADLAFNREFVEVFAGIIAAVMFGAAAVHTAVWKNSPRKPLLLLIATLLIAVFNAAAGPEPIFAPRTDPVAQVDSIIADTVSQ